MCLVAEGSKDSIDLGQVVDLHTREAIIACLHGLCVIFAEAPGGVDTDERPLNSQHHAENVGRPNPCRLIHSVPMQHELTQETVNRRRTDLIAATVPGNQGQLLADPEQAIAPELHLVFETIFATFDALEPVGHVTKLRRADPTEPSHNQTDVLISQIHEKIFKEDRNHSDDQIRQIGCDRDLSEGAP